MRRTACHECGILAHLPLLDYDYEHYCPRCGALIYRSGESFALVFTMALTSLLFFFPALLYPSFSLVIANRAVSSSLWEMIVFLFEKDHFFLGGAIIFFVLVIPLTILSSMVSVILFKARKLPSPLIKHALAPYRVFKLWHMEEVFLFSLLVASVKLYDLGDFTPEAGLLFIAGYAICFFTATMWFNTKDIWYVPEP